MTAPWWGREASPADQAPFIDAPVDSAAPPQLAFGTREAATSELRGRIPLFTPEWTNRRATDAGVALVSLFGEQMEPVLTRLDKLPDKAFVEFLRVGGISLLPPTPAMAMLEVTVADGALQSVLVPQGFQVGATPANGGSMVVFETQSNLYAAPAQIGEIQVQERTLFTAVDPASTTPFLPFGKQSRPGSALFIGLSGDVMPGPNLSLGFAPAQSDGTPPPVAIGGVDPVPIQPVPLLQWEVLDGGSYQPVGVVRDETAGLTNGGIVELQVPLQWRPGRPDGLIGDAQLRWLRLRIVHGTYRQSPILTFVKLNMVRATAVQTIHDEVLDSVSKGNGAMMQLSQAPVLPGTLILEVDEGGLETSIPTAAAGGSGPVHIWTQVDDLALFGPDDEVYVLDAATGQLSFGDGQHGKALPPGFRNVRALSYQVGGGEAGAVAVDQVKNPINSVSFISGVTNPQPATGGSDTETPDAARQRGPKEFRARARAVAVADYALLALRATGAIIKRAEAVPGLRPGFPGKPVPGVVCVFVIPPVRGAGPPTPEPGALTAVAEFLSNHAA
ncbi:MAG TPA: putative baseplate assembly protein, partial [Candidatus Binataceae bacterium]|nr:putative baseplate assembly protein [Candidatus Binataceae bacterium]